MTCNSWSATLHLALALVAVLVATPAAAGRHELDPRAPAAPAPEAFPDISRYGVLTVCDFDVAVPPRSRHGLDVATELADGIVESLQAKPVAGLEVRRGKPLGRKDELLLTGRLLRARVGSRAGRYFVGPLAAARVAADVVLVDAATSKEIETRHLERSWGVPGIAGSVKGLPSVVRRTAQGIARWIADARRAHPAAPGT
jgi:hypothetical protein